MLDAMAVLSEVIEVKFLFTMRSLPSLLNSQPGFDGGLCRHGLILAATISYFVTITRSLPRHLWRVVWYESMQDPSTRALFVAELGQWMGWTLPVGDWQPGDWHSSTKPTIYAGALGWAKMVEEALAVNGSLGKLLDRNQQLGFDDRDESSANKPERRLRALMADVKHTRRTHDLDDATLWATEWGCSEERDWYSQPQADLSSASAARASPANRHNKPVEGMQAERDAAQFLRCSALLSSSRSKEGSTGGGKGGGVHPADLIRCVELLQKE
jgi:hypothetical protein